MKISINNIGLISQANIELNGITVIGGLNSSGKSTILKAVYSLLYSNYDMKQKISRERENSLFQVIRNSEGNIGTLYHNYTDFKDLWWILNREFELKGELTLDFFSEIINQKIKTEYEKDDFNLFKLDEIYLPKTTSEQIAKLYENVKIVFERNNSEYEKFIFSKSFQNIFNRNINAQHSSEIGTVKIEYDNENSYASFNDNKLTSYNRFSNFINHIWYLNTCHFTDILDFRRNSLIRNELRTALEKEIDIDISYESFNDIEENSETLEMILKEILHGSLDISEAGRSLLYRDENTNTSFEMENVASGMKNLLVIQKMLQNGSLGKGDILLIDEPETNLHPEWQVKFAEILVLLNKELNIKVLINSHSPYFMRAIEVFLANYEMKSNGKFYIMREKSIEKFVTEDVTDTTNEIYKMLYKPLDYL